MRAMSWRTWRSRPVFSSWPVACWKRRLNSSSRDSLRRCSNSCSASSTMSLAFKTAALPRHEPALEGELVHGQTDCLAGQLLGHAGDLEHDAARFHHGHPLIGRAFAGAHAGLSRLLGYGLMREDVDPHLAASLHLAGHRDTGGFDLPARDPARLERLKAELPELHSGLAFGLTAHTAALLLSMFYPLR